MPMPPRFADTTAVVTGASSGIGRAIAMALAQEGLANLVIHYRQNKHGAEETAEAVARLGCNTALVAADLASPADAERLCREAFEAFGPVHSWINNAGADVLTGEASEWNFDKKLKCLLEVDVLGTIGLSRCVAQRIATQACGMESASPPPRPPSMTFIGWDQAVGGMEGDAGQMFGPVKAAVMAFAASLAQSLAPDVRVNTVAPGWIQTAWGESTSLYWDRRARGQALMQRWGRPEDVARAVLHAADPNNTFLTAQTLQVNGGWNRRFRDSRSDQ